MCCGLGQAISNTVANPAGWFELVNDRTLLLHESVEQCEEKATRCPCLLDFENGIATALWGW